MRGPVEIVPGVWGLGSEIVNWYLVEDGGRLCAVDAGLSGFAKTLDQDLAVIGHSPGDAEAVVLTHCDADHTGLGNAFREQGARVLVHSGDEDRLRKPRGKGGDASARHVLPQLWRPGLWRLFGHLARHGGAKPAAVEPSGAFENGDLLDVPGRPRVIATPGHTRGHCALLFEGRRALFAGDALCTFNPVTGVGGPQLMPSWLNASTEQALASLGELEAVEAEVLLVGHGEPWREGLRAAVERARARGPT